MTTKKNISSKVIAEKLLPKFHEHIGFKKSVSKKDLFKYCFGNTYSDKSYADFYKAECMRRALHYLRVNSNCFVASFTVDGVRHYAVISTMEEANHYCTVLENNITKMRRMQVRAKRSVREGWFKRKFELNLVSK